MTQKRANELYSFLEDIVKNIVEDEVLHPFPPYFASKRHSTLSNQEKLESLRFS